MSERLLGLRVVARVLIHNQAGELLLCRSQDGKAWVPPGGTVELGETLSTAALREAEEEAGLKVTPGRLIYLQEFMPKSRDELVLEVAFAAVAQQDMPAESLVEEGMVQQAGPPERPWGAWYIRDIGGPLREVRWFTREQVMTAALPVYPDFMRERYWQLPSDGYDPYLGLVRAT